MKKSLLITAAILSTSAIFGQCSEIFFSEYVEGSAQNKALEVYNPTQDPIDLSNYVIKRYSNGSLTAAYELVLSGTIASGDAIIVVNNQTDTASSFGWVDPVLNAMGDILGSGNYNDSPMFFNGNDAMTLENVNGSIVDIIGKVGEDPGASWTDDASANFTDANGGTYWTKDQTLIRKATVQGGITSNPALFNATLEWDSLPQNTWTELGEHSCDCIQTGIEEAGSNETVLFFPNPSTGSQFTIKASATIKNVEIFNVVGKEVYSYPSSQRSGELVVSTTSFTPGLYLVRTTFHNNRSMTSRVTIK